MHVALHNVYCAHPATFTLMNPVHNDKNNFPDLCLCELQMGSK